MDHHDPTAKGEAWFDSVQLEQSNVSSSYNPIINSSFEASLDSWTGTGGTIDSEPFDGEHSLKMTSSSTYTQSIS